MKKWLMIVTFWLMAYTPELMAAAIGIGTSV